MRSRGMVTLFDVARVAGVSHQTVSRVVNEKAGVAESTRENVWKAIIKLGYQPNVAARQLASNRSKTIGLVTYATEHTIPAATLMIIDQTAREKGYRVILASLSNPGFEAINEAVRDLRAHGVAGLVFNVSVALNLSDLKSVLSQLPAVFMDMVAVPGFTTIVSDHAKGMHAMVDHLLDLGHRKIAYIGGIPSWTASQQRLTGLEAALHARGLALGPFQAADWTAEGGYRAMQMLLNAASRDFTAVIACNDDMAIGAMAALREAGLSVPEDISVCGYEHMPTSGFAFPPLDTVKLDFARVIEEGFALLLKQMTAMRIRPTHLTLPVELILRQSSAPPKIAGSAGEKVRPLKTGTVVP